MGQYTGPTAYTTVWPIPYPISEQALPIQRTAGDQLLYLSLPIGWAHLTNATLHTLLYYTDFEAFSRKREDG